MLGMPHGDEQGHLRLSDSDRGAGCADGGDAERDAAAVSLEVRRLSHVLGRWCDVHDVKVRAATMDDAAALASLAGELGYPTDAAEMSIRFAAVSESRNDAIFVA